MYVLTDQAKHLHFSGRLAQLISSFVYDQVLPNGCGDPIVPLHVMLGFKADATKAQTCHVYYICSLHCLNFHPKSGQFL